MESSSDRDVLAHRVTFPARSEISVVEWLTTRNFATGFLFAVSMRSPVTSTYFCKGLLTFCRDGFAGFSTPPFPPHRRCRSAECRSRLPRESPEMLRQIQRPEAMWASPRGGAGAGGGCQAPAVAVVHNKAVPAEPVAAHKAVDTRLEEAAERAAARPGEQPAAATQEAGRSTERGLRRGGGDGRPRYYCRHSGFLRALSAIRAIRFRRWNFVSALWTYPAEHCYLHCIRWKSSIAEA